jgi:hypothetical protein
MFHPLAPTGVLREGSGLPAASGFAGVSSGPFAVARRHMQSSEIALASTGDR